MATIKIMSRYGGVLREVEADSLRLALEQEAKQGADLRGADLQGADLQGAYLQGAYLQGADLQGAYLQGADLRGADLRGADLQGADLRGADLRGAYLQGAYLQGAKINWNSHTLISEILLRAAGEDVLKRMVAGLISVSTDWCWNKFLAVEHDLREWALDELAKWVQETDSAPPVVTSRVKTEDVEVSR